MLVHQLTSRGHKFWSDCLIFKIKVIWKLDSHIFPMPLKSSQSLSGKAFKWATEVGTKIVVGKDKIADISKRNWYTLSKTSQIRYKYPPTSQNSLKKRAFGAFSRSILSVFSLNSLPHTSTHTQILDSFILHTSRGSVLASISSSLVHLPRFWGLKGVDVTF